MRRRTIPVLVGGDSAPTRAQLSALGPLGSLTPAVLSDPISQRDIDRLVAAVELAAEGNGSAPPAPTPVQATTPGYSPRSQRSDEVIEELLRDSSRSRASVWVAVFSLIVAAGSVLVLVLVLWR